MAQRNLKKRQGESGVEKPSLLKWTEQYRQYLAPGKVFDTEGHRYMTAIYAEDNYPEVVMCKAGQIGASEYLISWLFWNADINNATGLYILPTDGDVSDFSAGRIGPAIEASEYLANIVIGAGGEQRGADKVTLKRVRDRFIYLRGGKVRPNGSAPQLKSVPADALVLDELDEIDRKAIDLAKQRLGHSAIAATRMASTPTYPGVGIHAEYLNSDQREWHLRCESCGAQQAVTIDRLVREWDELGRPAKWNGDDAGPFLACVKCDKPLDRLGAGEWVAAYPSRTVRGYALSRLFAAHRPLSEIIQGLSSVDESVRQQTYNQGLGLPYRPSTAHRLTDEILKSCQREYGLGAKPGATFMGIDVGRVLHVVIRGREADGNRPLRFAGTVQDFDEAARLIEKFGVKRCVVDALPETRQAREFQTAHKSGAVWLAYYIGAKKEAEAEGWNEDDGVVNLDRTRTLDNLMALFSTAANGEPGNTLPANIEAVEDYFSHLKALQRVLHKGRDGNQIPTYVETGPDHFAHAENYCAAAQAKADLSNKLQVSKNLFFG